MKRLCDLQKLFFHHEMVTVKELMIIENRSANRTEPCGTPESYNFLFIDYITVFIFSVPKGI